jgi:hypothetical protein
MGKICLVAAGNFILAIDAAVIISTWNAESLLAAELGANLSLLHLESFLAQRSLAVLNPEAVVLEVECGTGLLILLVDRVIGEIEAPHRFEPLPLLYPELAAKCCPQLFIHKAQLVLRLDLLALCLMREKQQTGYGFVSLDELVHARNSGLEDSETATPGSWQNEVGITASGVKETPGIDVSDSGSAGDKAVLPKTEINDVFFRKIITWTIGKYIECESDDEVVINAKEVPHELIHHTGVNNTTLQLFINKTVQRCKRCNNEVLQLLKNKLEDLII